MRAYATSFAKPALYQNARKAAAYHIFSKSSSFTKFCGKLDIYKIDNLKCYYTIVAQIKGQGVLKDDSAANCIWLFR